MFLKALPGSNKAKHVHCATKGGVKKSSWRLDEIPEVRAQSCEIENPVARLTANFSPFTDSTKSRRASGIAVSFASGFTAPASENGGTYTGYPVLTSCARRSSVVHLQCSIGGDGVLSVNTVYPSGQRAFVVERDYDLCSDGGDGRLDIQEYFEYPCGGLGARLNAHKWAAVIVFFVE